MDERKPWDREPDELIEIGGSVDHTTMTLRIMGDDLIPEEVTASLRFPPSMSRRKGDKWKGKKTGREYVARTGQWHLEAPDGIGDIDQQIHWILDALPRDRDVWGALRAKYRIDLFCGLFLGAWNRGVNLSAGTIRELAERGIDIGFDIYSHVEEGKE